MTTSPPSDALRPFAPFDKFEPVALAFLDERAVRTRFPAGTVLVAPERGVADAMYIVIAGQVQATEPGYTRRPGESELFLGAGECFPIGALMGQRAAANVYTATKDSDVYVLPAAAFHQLLELSPAFSHYCNGYLAKLVTLSRQQMQAKFTHQASQQQSLTAPLHSLIKRAPISVKASTTIQRAVEIMGELKIGSVIVVDDHDAPIGLLTQSDVVRRIVLGRIPLERPITDAMSGDPATLPESASAYDAMFAMASRGIRHLLLVDEAGRLTGVVSERDLFALQRVGLGQVRRAIESAQTVDGVKAALADVRQSAFSMLAQGVGAEQLTQYISALNDAATVRVIQMNLARVDLAGIEWAWLAFGSEGREEQTLTTDQDNGIVFLTPTGGDAEETRTRLLAFAQQVNRDLDVCGFTLCKGNIMAGNPEWCLTLEGWKRRFTSWIASPKPEALLNATIFFDFRALYGQKDLADRMHEHLFSLSRPDQAFQKMLAANALLVAPPLGLIRDFVTESDDKGRAFIDLKKSGARLFVDAARVLALADGVAEASTVARLRKMVRNEGKHGIEAMIDAFNFIQLLRLRHQHLEDGEGRPGDNRIFIGRLNELDRRILKEAFKQVKKLQQRLRVTYQF